MVDGFIGPKGGLKPELYDPWKEYRSAQQPPYLSLVNLIDHLPTTSADGTGIKIRKEGEKPLLEWCQQYGLLGLLPQQTSSFTLPPRWEPRNQFEGDTFDRTLIPKQRSYERSGYGWISHAVEY